MDDERPAVDPGADPSPFLHQPVMVDLVVELLGAVPGGVYLDATLGGGAHAEAVLDAHPGLRLLGVDRDDDATTAAARRLERFGDRVEIVRSGFADLGRIVEEDRRRRRSDVRRRDATGIDAEQMNTDNTTTDHTTTDQTDEGVTAVLFDLGVSSPQLDQADRGFSYRRAAPLDMRMDRSQTLSASDVVNDYTYPQLARVIGTYGEERFAGRIARAIIDARPISDTEHLASVIKDAIPAATRRHGGHPAKRTFQAIRVEVNGELDQLAEGLDAAIADLAPGGRMVVMSYQSLEDRIVKQRFNDAATGGCACPPGLPCACGAQPTVRLLRRGAWKATDAEVDANPRASSVRIRAVEAIQESA